MYASANQGDNQLIVWLIIADILRGLGLNNVAKEIKQSIQVE